MNEAGFSVTPEITTMPVYAHSVDDDNFGSSIGINSGLMFRIDDYQLGMELGETLTWFVKPVSYNRSYFSCLDGECFSFFIPRATSHYERVESDRFDFRAQAGLRVVVPCTSIAENLNLRVSAGYALNLHNDGEVIHGFYTSAMFEFLHHVNSAWTILGSVGPEFIGHGEDGSFELGIKAGFGFNYSD